MSKRAGINEIIPGKLYQRGNFLTWPYEKKRRLFAEYGITLVVNMWCKVDPDMSPTDLDRIYLNWYCSPSAVPPNAEISAKFVADMLKAGHVGLIHCEAGRGRSVWFTTRVLALLENIPLKDAFSKVLIAVPSADVTEVLKRNLA